MKKLVRLVILGAILCPIISIAISCSEEADCSMTARPMVDADMAKVAVERASQQVRTNLAEYLEKGIVK